MIKKLKKMWLYFFKRYRRLEFKLCTYAEGDRLIRASAGKPEREQWIIAPEEDRNRAFGVVYLERRERITE